MKDTITLYRHRPSDGDKARADAPVMEYDGSDQTKAREEAEKAAKEEFGVAAETGMYWEDISTLEGDPVPGHGRVYQLRLAKGTWTGFSIQWHRN